MNYRVTVGNIGTVYSGSEETKATENFSEYVRQSESGVGRAGDEEVVLWQDGEPVLIHESQLEQEENGDTVLI